MTSEKRKSMKNVSWTIEIWCFFNKNGACYKKYPFQKIFLCFNHGKRNVKVRRVRWTFMLNICIKLFKTQFIFHTPARRLHHKQRKCTLVSVLVCFYWRNVVKFVGKNKKQKSNHPRIKTMFVFLWTMCWNVSDRESLFVLYSMNVTKKLLQ